MRNRLAVLVLVLAFWASIAAADRYAGTGVVHVDREQRRADPAVVREDLYLSTLNNRRGSVPAAGTSRMLTHRLSTIDSSGAERARVLVLGDSYTFGWGLVDLNARWTEVMYRDLQRRSIDIDVVTLALPGASVYSYADWAQEVLRADPNAPWSGPFDVVIVGWVDNDLIPAPNELGIDGGQLVEVPLDDIDDVVRGRIRNPNDFAAAVRSIAEVAPERLWLPLRGIETDVHQSVDRIGEDFERLGFRVVPTPRSNTITTQQHPGRLVVSSVDHHPNAALHLQYGLDAAEALSTLLEKSAASQPKPTQSVPLISNVVPVDVQLAQDGEQVQVGYDGTTPPACEPIQKRGARIVCGEGAGVVEFEDGDTTAVSQRAPCLALGDPHVLLFFDPSHDRQSIRLELLEGPLSGVDVAVIRYDDLGFVEYQSRRPIHTNETVEIDIAGASGLAIASAGIGCALVDVLLPPAFSLRMS